MEGGREGGAKQERSEFQLIPPTLTLEVVKGESEVKDFCKLFCDGLRVKIQPSRTVCVNRATATYSIH